MGVIWALVGGAVGLGVGWTLGRKRAASAAVAPPADPPDRAPGDADFQRAFAHAIRNPLSGIQLLVELGLEEVEEEAARRTLGRVQEQADALADLVSRFSEASALDAGRIPVEPVPVALGEALQEAVEAFMVKASDKGQRLELQADRPGPKVDADPSALHRVVGHLLSNAVVFSPKGGMIRIRTEEGPETVMVSVQDEGPGIPPGELARAFDRFARLSPRPTGNEPCAGVGLSVAKRLAEAMGGTLTLASVAGKGTTCFLSLRKSP